MKDFVGDNSFYSCYLNDIEKPDVLIIYLDSFKHHIGPRIKNEMSCSTNYFKIKTHKNFNYFPESKIFSNSALISISCKSDIIQVRNRIIKPIQ